VDEQTAATPDIEIVIKTDGREIFVLGFFRTDEGGYDYVAGMEDGQLAPTVAELLAEASKTIRTVAFHHSLVAFYPPDLGLDATDDPFPF